MTADKTDDVPEEYNYDCIMDTIGDEFFPQLKKRLNLEKTDPEWQAANEYFKCLLQSPDKRYLYIITLQKTLGTMKSFQTRI